MADKTQQDAETASDPEEDDLSDLDDVLDEFDSKPKLPFEPKPTASGPGRPPLAPAAAALPTEPELALEDEPTAAAAAAAAEEEDLAAQLQAGMGSLISELDENPEMQRQFEAMMQELIGASNAGSGAQTSMPKDLSSEATTTSKAGAAAGKKEDTFQDTIRKTMERMQQSGDAATAAAAESDKEKSEEEMLMEMLKSMGTGGGGEEGEEDFNQMLMNMMTQLVNKDILYEPMKELDTKFPAWMEKNKDVTKKEDLERYREQERLVREIVGRFERKGYRDENDEDREYIVERMQKMQEAGSPPPDLVGDMSAAQEALGEMEQGCPTQ